jgi:hypothetical protein
MTDIITTAPITFRRPVFSSLRFPKLGIGQALARIQEEFRHALDLAYVQPFSLGRGQLPVVLEGSEEGRDPSW